MSKFGVHQKAYKSQAFRSFSIIWLLSTTVTGLLNTKHLMLWLFGYNANPYAVTLTMLTLWLFYFLTVILMGVKAVQVTASYLGYFNDVNDAYLRISESGVVTIKRPLDMKERKFHLSQVKKVNLGVKEDALFLQFKGRTFGFKQLNEEIILQRKVQQDLNSLLASQGLATKRKRVSIFRKVATTSPKTVGWDGK